MYLYRCPMEGCSFSTPRGHDLLRHHVAIHRGKKVAVCPTLEAATGSAGDVSPQVAPGVPPPVAAAPQSASTSTGYQRGGHLHRGESPGGSSKVAIPVPDPSRISGGGGPASEQKTDGSQKLEGKLTPVTITKQAGQQRQIRTSTGGLVTVPRLVPLHVVDLPHPAMDSRRRAFPDAEKQKKALEAKVQRVGAALTKARRPPFWKAAQGLRAVQLMLDRR